MSRIQASVVIIPPVDILAPGYSSVRKFESPLIGQGLRFGRNNPMAVPKDCS